MKKGDAGRRTMNIFQKIKSGVMISGVVLVIAGIVLLFFPEAMTKTIAYVTVVVLILMGIGQIIGYLCSEPGRGSFRGGMAAGICLLIAGILIYFRAEAVISIIPIILGVIIVISGIARLQQAVDLARMKAQRWSTVLATAILNIILGGVIVFNPFSTVMTLLRFVGVGMIYSGISDIIATIYLWNQTQDFYEQN